MRRFSWRSIGIMITNIFGLGDLQRCIIVAVHTPIRLPVSDTDSYDIWSIRSQTV